MTDHRGGAATSAPVASVVVCCYDEARWDDLTAAIGSLAAQTAVPSEVVLVVDHNPELQCRAEAAFTTARVVANSGRRGLSGARNTGVRSTAAEIVAFLDDDAVAEPTWLAELLAPYADPQVAAVGGKALPAWPDGKAPAQLPPELYWVVGCGYSGQPETISEVRNLMGCAMSFRRELVLRLGGFAEDIGRTASLPLGCEETELCIRLRQQVPGAKVVLQPRALVRHRVTTERTRWGYLRKRSWSEGLSKAAVARLVGAEDALSTERSYVRSVLPGALVRAAGKGVRGGRVARADALATVGGVLLATSAAGAGYLVGGLRSARNAPKPRAVAGRLDPVPPISVIVATAGEPDDVRRCVRSVLDTGYADLEVLVVDNAAGRGRYELVELAATDERIRYLREPEPGASRARNRGAREATGSVLAFTDDDAVVDARWLTEIVAELAEPGTDCVTGLVVPLSLDTEAQSWFEAFGGFGKGEERQVFGAGGSRSASQYFLAPGAFGSGNNMAWRRESFLAISGFDERLGPGRATRSGEDLDLFLRLMTTGGRLIYTPQAVVWHEHRRTERELRKQLRGYGTGLVAMYLLHARRPSGLAAIARALPQGLRALFDPRSERNAERGPGYPRKLKFDELRGMSCAPAALLREARRPRERVL